jgi:hypothetical protein
MDWAHGLVFSKQPFKTGMFGVVCDSSRTSSLSDYKFPTRLVDAFLLAQPAFAFIQNCELTQDVVCLSFLKNQTSIGNGSAAQKDMRHVYDRDVGSLSTKYVWECYKLRPQVALLLSFFFSELNNDFAIYSKCSPQHLCGESLVFQELKHDDAMFSCHPELTLDRSMIEISAPCS